MLLKLSLVGFVKCMWRQHARCEPVKLVPLQKFRCPYTPQKKHGHSFVTINSKTTRVEFNDRDSYAGSVHGRKKFARKQQGKAHVGIYSPTFGMYKVTFRHAERRINEEYWTLRHWCDNPWTKALVTQSSRSVTSRQQDTLRVTRSCQRENVSRLYSPVLESLSFSSHLSTIFHVSRLLENYCISRNSKWRPLLKTYSNRTSHS